jgi:nucleotide-binding universal stress UspA family protein
VKILIGYDGSIEARRALEWVVHFGPSSRITVISVARALEATAPIADAIDPTSEISSQRLHLEEAVLTLTALGLTAETLLRVGNPAEQIITVAAEGGFDLVVVGSRGMGAVRRFLIGSVADRVVRHAGVPVLMVR